jgi:hypothetical protein
MTNEWGYVAQMRANPTETWVPLTVEPAFHQVLGVRRAPGLFLVYDLTVE